MNFILSDPIMKILLVENDTLNFHRVKDFLEAEGHTIIEHPEYGIVDNYEDALLLYKQEMPHIAILDIELNGKKSGLDIGQYITERYNTPIIFLSGHGTDENLRRSGLMGANGFVLKITKPYDLDQLKANIKLLTLQAETAWNERKEGAWFHLRDVQSNLGFCKTRLLWNEVLFITTKNAPKDSVLINMTDGRQYVCHRSLTDLHEDLPATIIRHTKTLSVNACFFNRNGKVIWVNYIDNERYEVEPAFRNEKIEAILRDLLR